MALADRERIMHYIAKDNPAAAVKLDELIQQKAEQLGSQPPLYRIGRKPGTCEMVVHPNYLVIYRIHKSCRNSAGKTRCEKKSRKFRPS
jgi:addiction module RelE/StbE family toxin